MHKRESSGQAFALDQRGMNALLVPLVIVIVLFVAAAGFGFWAFTERQDYKNNSDQKSALAVAQAEELLTKKLDAEFLEREKEPLKAYESPSAFGTVRIMYPKTWGAYVVEQTATGSSSPVQGYFHPGFVPNIQKNDTEFAIRLEIVQRAYDNELKQLDAGIKQGKVRVAPYRATLVPEVLGTRVDGEFLTKKNGSMVMFPLRDKTVKVYTESQAFLNDFEKYILPNLRFEK